MASRVTKRQALVVAGWLAIAGLCLVAFRSPAGHLRDPLWLACVPNTEVCESSPGSVYYVGTVFSSSLILVIEYGYEEIR